VKRPLAVLTAAVGVCALAAGVESTALLALATGLILLMAAGWSGLVLSTRRLGVERTISVFEVQEDAPLRVHFTVQGATWLPVTVEVEDHRGGWVKVDDGGAWLELHVGQPGAYWLQPSRVRLRDVSGLFQRESAAGRAEPLLILPVPVASPAIRAVAPGLSEDLEPHGVRPYVPGSPFTRVHWPSLARGAGLHVRQVAPLAEGLPLVVVDTVGAGSRAALHWAARTAAGSVLTLARNGGCRVLLPGDPSATSVFDSGHAWRTVHRRLAKLDPSPSRLTRPVGMGTAALRVSAASAPSVPAPALELPTGILGRD
jgi:uncharacterized protein (DUF58 family)